jgi:hypothetical protein
MFNVSIHLAFSIRKDMVGWLFFGQLTFGRLSQRQYFQAN